MRRIAGSCRYVWNKALAIQRANHEAGIQHTNHFGMKSIQAIRVKRVRHVSSENGKTQSRFECVVCGFAENADLNAALNIQRAGHALSACQVNGAPRPSATGTRRSDQHHGVSDAVGILVL